MIKSIINPSDIDRFYLKNEYYVEYIDNVILKNLYPDSNLCQGKNFDVFSKSNPDDKFIFVINNDICQSNNKAGNNKEEIDDVTLIPYSKFKNTTKKQLWSSSPSSYSFDKLNNTSLVEKSIYESNNRNLIKFYDILDPLYQYLHFFRYQLKMLLKGYKEPYFTLSDMVIRSKNMLEKYNEEYKKNYNYKKFILNDKSTVDPNDKVSNIQHNSSSLSLTNVVVNDPAVTNKLVSHEIDIIQELHKYINDYNIDITKNANIQKYYPVLKTSTFYETGIIMELQKYYDIDSTIDELDNTSTAKKFSKISGKYALQIAVLYMKDIKKGMYLFKSKINNNILDEFFKNTVMAYDSYKITIDNKTNKTISDKNEKYESLITKLKNLLTPVKTGGLKNKTKKNEKQYSGGFNLGLKRTARNISNTVVGENPLYDFLNQIFFKTACYINKKIINDMEQLFKNEETKKIALNAGYESHPYIYLFIVKTLRKTMSIEKICYTQSRFLHCSKVRKLTEIIKSILNNEKKYVIDNEVYYNNILKYINDVNDDDNDLMI
jgi:hypothetical protein